MKKILVIGATGMIGKPVTRQLLRAGFDITLMARNVAKAKAIFPEANIVYGDVFDPLSLLPVFEGKDAVYINLGPSKKARPGSRMAEQEGIDNIISVAQKTDVKRLAFLSSLVQNYNGMNGFHWWIFDIKQEAVEKIKASGIPYTIFFASSFMETIPDQMMKGSKIMLAGESKAPMYFIAAGDFGKQVAQSFHLLTTENKEYVIQGTEAYNWDEAARIVADNHNKRRLKIMKVPLGMIKLFGNFSPFFNYGAKILEALNNYPEQFQGESTWKELGRPTITLAEFAKTME